MGPKNSSIRTKYDKRSIMKPYTAVINISVKLYPIDSTGEINGINIPARELQKQGITNKIIQICKPTYEECVEATLEKLKEIK